MAFFAARQPILDKDKNLFAYELLFRESLENVFPQGINDDEATSKMIAGLQFNLGLDNLTQNKPAFINFTQDTLLKRFPMVLPHDQVVVEVLETVKPGKKLLEACIELKEKGYTLALDDYEHQAVWKHFYPYIDIIKVDYKLSPLAEIKQIIEAVKPFPHIKLLAEKVENYEEFNQALELGFSYFQGYFFSRPEVMESRNLTPSQMILARLTAELAEDVPDIDRVSKVFEQDVTLSFKLLRYAKSPLFQRRQEISTIKHALVLIGEEELRRFVSLLFAAQFADDKPAELTVMSLFRARFCELLAERPEQREDQSAAFLIGLLSLLDAMLDAKLDELLEKLPLSEKVHNTLCKGEGKLAAYLKLAQALECADWPEVEDYCQTLRMERSDVENLYQEALEWVAERQEYYEKESE